MIIIHDETTVLKYLKEKFNTEIIGHEYYRNIIVDT